MTLINGVTFFRQILKNEDVKTLAKRFWEENSKLINNVDFTMRDLFNGEW